MILSIFLVDFILCCYPDDNFVAENGKTLLSDVQRLKQRRIPQAELFLKQFSISHCSRCTVIDFNFPMEALIRAQSSEMEFS
jgi:hypothetical protein